MKCASLFHIFSLQLEDCHVFDTAAAVRLTQEIPMNGVHRYLDIPQLRFQSSHVSDGFFLQTRIDGIRSAVDGSYIGIDGETIVWTLNRAQFGWSNGNVVLYGGLTDDLWVYGQNESWLHRNQFFGMAESFALMQRSDVGFSGLYQQENWSVQFRMASGEGENYQERNVGFNSQIQATVKVHEHEITIFGQEGSRGFSAAPEHRVAMRISSKEHLGYGIEMMKAWGVQSDSTLQPWAASLWVRQLPKKGFWGYLRSDFLSYETPSSFATIAGLGYGFSTHMSLVLGTNQRWKWESGYQSAESQNWLQSYYIQLQYDLQSGFAWTLRSS